MVSKLAPPLAVRYRASQKAVSWFPTYLFQGLLVSVKGLRMFPSIQCYLVFVAVILLIFLN